MRLPRLLQPKWKIFVRHHERLAQSANPVLAEQKFRRRIAASRRVGMIRTMFFVGLYSSFVVAAVGFVLDYMNLAVGRTLDIVQAVFSSLTVVFLAGIFVCSRYLGYLEVDLHYYSVEAHFARKTG